MLKSLALATLVATATLGASAQTAVQQPPAAPAQQGQRAGGAGRGGFQQTPEQIAAARAREVENQKQTDALWRKASEGFMKMEKITYKSSAGGMDIPAFVFTPLQPRGSKAHAALVWVHPDIRGHVYEYYYPYVREAVSRGYVVIAPEYRGSFGYGAAHYDAIDYGGEEVDDVVTAVSVLKTMPIVDPERIGIIGWSHGGMISLLSVERNPATFKAVAALVPVTNLFQRLAWSGVEGRKRAIDPADRIGGLPHEKRDEYKRRSPIYNVDNINIPVLVHLTKNDADVVIEEAMQLVDALRARKPQLAETKIYEDPIGGHLFDRMCPATLPGARGANRPDPTALESYIPTNTPEQRDSWNRVWAFLDWNLQPYR
jgi:dipeptidyl aminopeptidase/acylaminoacyl peptidase